MSNWRTDDDRAKELGMTLDQFRSLIGDDPLEQYYSDAGYKGPSDSPKKDDKKSEKPAKKEVKAEDGNSEQD